MVERLVPASLVAHDTPPDVDKVVPACDASTISSHLKRKDAAAGAWREKEMSFEDQSEKPLQLRAKITDLKT